MERCTNGNIAKASCNALQRAKNFLINSASKSGGWSDFQTNRSGESTSWVTAHVLWNFGKNLPEVIVEKSLKSLLNQRKTNGTWGYSEKTPSDCDSTLHVLQAFYELGVVDTIPEIDRTFRYVLAHQKADGGFSTYYNDDELVAYRGHGDDKEFQGWTQSHTCVTAVAIETLSLFPKFIPKSIIEKAMAFVLARQTAEGCWESYWWRTKFFATSRILRYIIRLDKPELNSALKHICDWLIHSADDNGFYTNGYDIDIPCPVSTALALRTLAEIDGQYALCLRCLNWLTKQQLADGSWLGRPIMQIPPPDLMEPNRDFSWIIGGKGVRSCSTDRNRIYTTVIIANAIDYLAQKDIENRDENNI